ncbi:hypothetical protein Q4E93_23710 [Flavitalea sp. BT771]|uniref:hypothetical protein n=1 Tax=Flavitalea sp. BT771 TaxID=3063329 RepID=UPI0026E163A3|nr:hypothetical protein [Flavitalea sp. BT771]MDO6433638.1 hypothetical protein [Flavitalea sp. BT771]MDV6222457.1 hypothetical protein [Flavitalea sp. BT771]
MKAIFVLFLLPLRLFSQDLSGIWVGTISTSQTQMPLELAINQDMTGYSMITFMFKGAEKIAVKKITLIRKDSVFTISDDKLVYNNFTVRSRSIKTFCELSIKMVDTIMVLSGPFHTRTRDLRAGDEDLSTGTITLQKQNRRAQTRLISKLDSLKLSNTLAFSNPETIIKETPVVAVSEKETPGEAKNPVKVSTAVKVQRQVGFQNGRNEPKSYAPNNITTIPTNPKTIGAAAELALRKTEAIRTIDFKSDSLILVLYDNGIVDGDTVSVVLNDEVIIPKQGLTEQAYRKVIKIPPSMGDSLQLVIYAENLGSIPPNSGLLIIEDGSDRYEVGFKGDMKKSPAVILRRKG